MKRALICAVLMAVSGTILMGCRSGAGHDPDVQRPITREEADSIKVGMKLDQAKRLLGRPINEDPTGAQWVGGAPGPDGGYPSGLRALCDASGTITSVMPIGDFLDGPPPEQIAQLAFMLYPSGMRRDNFAVGDSQESATVNLELTLDELRELKRVGITEEQFEAAYLKWHMDSDYDRQISEGLRLRAGQGQP